MLKVLKIESAIVPKKIELYNELAKYCELTLIYGVKNEKDKNISLIKEAKPAYKYHIIYPGIIDRIFAKYKKIIKTGIFSCIILEGYRSPMVSDAIKYLSQKKIPFILSVDSSIIPKKEFILTSWLKYSLISKASMWLTTCSATENYLIAYGAKKELIRCHPLSFLRQSEVHRATLEEKEKIKKELNIPYKKVVLNVGEFTYIKANDILIKAMSWLDKDIGCYIIGGPPRVEYMDIKEMLQLDNVRFLGYVEPKNLAKYYSIADIFAHPTRYSEWGSVISEAMSRGLPVITTKKCLAGKELIKDEENGYLINTDDIDALVNKLKVLLTDESLADRISSNNIAAMQNYTLEGNAKAHLNIIEEFSRTFNSSAS